MATALRYYLRRLHSGDGSNSSGVINEEFTRLMSDCVEIATFPSGKLTSGGKRKSKQAAKPIARSGHRIWCDDRYLYTVGGYNPDVRAEDDPEDSALLKEVWRLNLLTNEWRKLECGGEFPEEMASFSMVACRWRRELLLFGGTSAPFGLTATRHVRAFSLLTHRWRTVDCRSITVHPDEQGRSHLPIPAYGQSTVQLDDENILLIGGTTGAEYNMSVHRLTLPHPQSSDSAVWSNDLQGPECWPRYRHESVLFNDKVVVFGGGTRDETSGFELLDVYDVCAKGWSKTGTFGDAQWGYPTKRRCHSMVRDGNDVYILGGYDGAQLAAHEEPQMPSQLFDDIWKLNLPTVQWAKLRTKLTKPVFFHSSAITPAGCVLTYGGVLDAQGTRRSDVVSCFWLRPPPLSLLAAIKVVSSMKGCIGKLSDEQLLSLGVPHFHLQWIRDANDDWAG